ncbi:MAG: hypothetical protein LRY41_01915 [Candidatus Pacebacteria bacterium]|nr:hypothetical protein [Candidatus Paceibacterota bacterium]MCD8508163.1 hypothetical protein [Candidatus Paceibacterota bacterium]MCD8528066.1 hypothetical protein [Candidatus Paceibacterota bacterium]MCD8563401.1 hypothetical protein [Candidatus Paceibacterota bacterium]
MEKFPQFNDKKRTPEKSAASSQGEQLYFFNEENYEDAALTPEEETLVQNVIFESLYEEPDCSAFMQEHASEMIPEILSQFNKYDVAYSDPSLSPETRFTKSIETHERMANGIAALYGQMGFFGKVFVDHASEKTFWEIWHLASNGKESFIQGKDKNKSHEQVLQPYYSSRSLAESKINE